MKFFIATLVGVWLMVVVVFGARGAFVNPPGTMPLRVIIAATAPLAAFFVLFAASQKFRALMRIADLPLLTAIQGWRFAGLAFIALHLHNLLPGLFAWPAGLGDIAVGVTAPLVAFALVRRPGLARSGWFVAWNVFGILDLIVAVGSGALSASGLADTPMTPMAQMPLVLVPAFLVPLFIMMHVTALFQAGRSALYHHSAGGWTDVPRSATVTGGVVGKA